MSSSLGPDTRGLSPHAARLHTAAHAPILSGVEVMRKGHVEPFLHFHPALSSSSVRWAGVAVDDIRFQRASYRDTNTFRISFTWSYMVR
jgi:hypothetical protein